MRPRLRGYGRLEARDVPLGASLRLGTYADVDVTSGNYADAANIVPLSQRVLFGAGAYVGSRAGHVRLVASIQNLTNSRILDLVGYPVPGRAVFLTLSATTFDQPEENIP